MDNPPPPEPSNPACCPPPYLTQSHAVSPCHTLGFGLHLVPAQGMAPVLTPLPDPTQIQLKFLTPFHLRFRLPLLLPVSLKFLKIFVSLEYIGEKKWIFLLMGLHYGLRLFLGVLSFSCLGFLKWPSVLWGLESLYLEGLCVFFFSKEKVEKNNIFWFFSYILRFTRLIKCQKKNNLLSPKKRNMKGIIFFFLFLGYKMAK